MSPITAQDMQGHFRAAERQALPNNYFRWLTTEEVTLRNWNSWCVLGTLSTYITQGVFPKLSTISVRTAFPILTVSKMLTFKEQKSQYVINLTSMHTERATSEELIQESLSVIFWEFGYQFLFNALTCTSYLNTWNTNIKCTRKYI